MLHTANIADSVTPGTLPELPKFGQNPIKMYQNFNHLVYFSSTKALRTEKSFIAHKIESSCDVRTFWTLEERKHNFFSNIPFHSIALCLVPQTNHGCCSHTQWLEKERRTQFPAPPLWSSKFMFFITKTHKKQPSWEAQMYCGVWSLNAGQRGHQKNHNTGAQQQLFYCSFPHFSISARGGFGSRFVKIHSFLKTYS